MTVDTPRHPPRYHALDNLRGHMMLLGVVLHGSASYTVTPLGKGWLYQDSARSVAFDAILYGLHAFRMPVFFVMAGFFAALVYTRRGPRGFTQNRIRRILVPFILSALTLLPLAGVGLTFANRQTDPLWTPPWQVHGAELHLGHLWFLYYLLYFYVVAMLLYRSGSRVVTPAGRELLRALRWVVASRPGLAVLIPPTAAILLLMPGGVLEVPTGLRPSLPALIAYGLFFGFGWLLYLARELLPLFERHAVGTLAIGIVLLLSYLPYAVGALGGLPPHLPGQRVTAAALGAASVWCLVFALIGLYNRALRKPSPTARYVADASYWVYLVHVPMVIWSAGLLARWAAPSGFKFATVLALSAGASFASYHWLVRHSVIGSLLTGAGGPRESGAADSPESSARVAAGRGAAP